jgi:hypothetical protein
VSQFAKSSSKEPTSGQIAEIVVIALPRRL